MQTNDFQLENNYNLIALSKFKFTDFWTKTTVITIHIIYKICMLAEKVNINRSKINTTQ